MMVPLYFIHGMPPDSDELDGLMPSCVCDLDYIDSLTPEERAKEPEVEILSLIHIPSPRDRS